MTINCAQLREVIIKPVLGALGLFSDEAVNLLLGTAAVETQLGRYIVQPDGRLFEGGIGIYQCDIPTYNDIWTRYIAASPAMKARIQLYVGYNLKPPAQRLASDLILATIICRLHYARIGQPIPVGPGVKEMAVFWKKWYNPYGSIENFIKNYKEYVA